VCCAGFARLVEAQRVAPSTWGYVRGPMTGHESEQAWSDSVGIAAEYLTAPLEGIHNAIIAGARHTGLFHNPEVHRQVVDWLSEPRTANA